MQHGLFMDGLVNINPSNLRGVSYFKYNAQGSSNSIRINNIICYQLAHTSVRSFSYHSTETYFPCKSPFNSISFTLKIAVTESMSVILPLQTIWYASSNGSFFTTN